MSKLKISLTEFKKSLEEFKKLKNESTKVKLDYIATYYWIPILAAVILLVIVISQVVHFTTAKDMALSGRFINANADETLSQKYIQRVSKTLGIDEGESEISLSNSFLSADDMQSTLATRQLIAAEAAAKSLDFLIGDMQLLLEYAYDEYFTDIRTILSQEQIARLSPYFLYMDQGYTPSDANFPDPTAPEIMKKPIPFALRIPEGSIFDLTYYAHTEDLVGIAALSNAQNRENIAKFIDMLYK